MLDRVLPPERLPELLAESDFVVLAAPLTADTVGLIDEAAIAAMKPGAWVINVARGELVDERALAAGAARRPDRRRGAGHVPRGAAAADVAALRPAERDPHAAHVVVVDPRPRPVRRPVLRQPPALRRGRAARQRRGPDRRATDSRPAAGHRAAR